MKDTKNLNDEEVKYAGGGDPENNNGNPWAEITPSEKNRPQFPDPDPKPTVNPNPKSKSDLICPKCGNNMMFKIVEFTSQGKRLRCMVCNTEFVR